MSNDFRSPLSPPTTPNTLYAPQYAQLGNIQPSSFQSSYQQGFSSHPVQHGAPAYGQNTPRSGSYPTTNLQNLPGAPVRNIWDNVDTSGPLSPLKSTVSKGVVNVAELGSVCMAYGAANGLNPVILKDFGQELNSLYTGIDVYQLVQSSLSIEPDQLPSFLIATNIGRSLLDNVAMAKVKETRMKVNSSLRFNSKKVSDCEVTTNDDIEMVFDVPPFSGKINLALWNEQGLTISAKTASAVRFILSQISNPVTEILKYTSVDIGSMQRDKTLNLLPDEVIFTITSSVKRLFGYEHCFRQKAEMSFQMASELYPDIINNYGATSGEKRSKFLLRRSAAAALESTVRDKIKRTLSDFRSAKKVPTPAYRSHPMRSMPGLLDNNTQLLDQNYGTGQDDPSKQANPDLDSAEDD